jgi:hypothetical protein
MKCENEDCTNEVDIEMVEHLCAGYFESFDMNNRFCSCCFACRQECIDASQKEFADMFTKAAFKHIEEDNQKMNKFYAKEANHLLKEINNLRQNKAI